MMKRATTVALAAVGGIASVAAVAFSHANPKPGSSVTYGVSNRHIEGAVFATPRANGIIGVLVSLHNLEAGKRYELTGNSKPCSVVDAADYVLWRKGFEAKAADDVFAKARVGKEDSGRLRSFRLSLPTGAGDDQVECLIGITTEVEPVE